MLSVDTIQQLLTTGNVYYTDAGVDTNDEGLPDFSNLVPPVRIVNVLPMLDVSRAVLVTEKNMYITALLDNSCSSCFTDYVAAKTFYAAHLYCVLDKLNKDRDALMAAYEHKIDECAEKLTNEIKSMTKPDVSSS